MARQCKRPDWIPAAALYSEYRDVLDLRMPEAFDPAGIITAARQIFQDSPDFLAAERERLQLISWMTSRKRTRRSSNCSPTSQPARMPSSPPRRTPWFRASAGRAQISWRSFPGLLAPDGAILERPLWTAHRQAPAVAESWLSVAGRISRGPEGSPHAGSNSPAPAGAGPPRPQPDPAPDGPPGADATGDGRGTPAAVPGPRTAVCGAADPRSPAERRPGTRGHRRDRAQRRPAQPAAAVPGRPGDSGPDSRRRIRGPDEVAVRPLLDAYAVALDPAVLTPESAVSLLTSRIGGATAIELRRLRQSLRREELLGGGGRTSDALLVEALLEPGALATLGIEGHSARRIARMIRAGRDAAGPRGQRRDGAVGALAFHRPGHPLDRGRPGRRISRCPGRP